MIKQYLVVRKDARTVTGEPVSAHKLAVMVAHASMAFLSNLVLDNEKEGHVAFDLDDDTLCWLIGIFTKVLLEAKNLHALEWAGRRQGFFLHQGQLLDGAAS